MKRFRLHSVVGLTGCLVAMSFDAAPSTGAVLTVGPGKPYSTINSAIAAANSEDTVRISDGVYSEDLIVNKRLRLEAENVGGAIIDGGSRGTDFIIDVRADTDIFGLHIRNGNAAVNQHDFGVHYTCTRCIVTDTEVAFGISNSGATNGSATILNSVVYNVWNAVSINDGGPITIENSIIADTTYAYGIHNGVGIFPSHNLLSNVSLRESYGPIPGPIGADPNEIVAYPLFVNPAASDFRLMLGSPAIDSGKDVGLPYYGLAPDRGAFETVPEPCGIMLAVSGLMAGSATLRKRKYDARKCYAENCRE